MRILALCALVAACCARMAAGADPELTAILADIGLEEVRGEGSAADRGWAEGLLPGAGEGEILWTARCGEAGSSSPACRSVGELIEDLRRTPLRHDLRIVLLRGGGSIFDWITNGTARGETAEGRSRVLAALHHEADLRGGDRPIVLDLPIRSGSEARGAPGWLVHAVLRAGESGGQRPAVGHGRFPVAAQLLLRSTRGERRTAAQALLEAGIPAVTLTDRSILEPEKVGAGEIVRGAGARPAGTRPAAWADLSAAAVRRLDALAGRPRYEDSYLVFSGRVWLPRDLYWAGFVVWILLVLRGLPGRWRGASGESRKARGRTYLPGLAFRMLFLVALFVAPIFAAPLLIPAAIVALVPRLGRWTPPAQRLVGLLPLSLFVAVLAVAAARGTVSGIATGWPAPLLIGAALAAFWVTLGTVSPGAELPTAVPPTAVPFSGGSSQE